MSLLATSTRTPEALRADRLHGEDRVACLGGGILVLHAIFVTATIVVPPGANTGCGTCERKGSHARTVTAERTGLLRSGVMDCAGSSTARSAASMLAPQRACARHAFYKGACSWREVHSSRTTTFYYRYYF